MLTHIFTVACSTAELPRNVVFKGFPELYTSFCSLGGIESYISGNLFPTGNAVHNSIFSKDEKYPNTDLDFVYVRDSITSNIMVFNGCKHVCLLLDLCLCSLTCFSTILSYDFSCCSST